MHQNSMCRNGHEQPWQVSQKVLEFFSGCVCSKLKAEGEGDRTMDPECACACSAIHARSAFFSYHFVSQSSFCLPQQLITFFHGTIIWITVLCSPGWLTTWHLHCKVRISFVITHLLTDRRSGLSLQTETKNQRFRWLSCATICKRPRRSFGYSHL